MQPEADQPEQSERHPNALKPKKPRKPPGLARLSLTNLAPESSFVLTNTGTFQKGGFRINAGGVQDSPAKNGPHSTMALEQLEPLQMLGRGACGTVRLARHTPTGQMLALKAISIGDQSQRHQLLNELSVLVTLSHPNLVPLFDAFYLDGQVHIALGYMNGGSLEQLLAAYQEWCQGQGGAAQLVGMPERILAHVLVQVLCGLQHLHLQGVVHRDLKPANILFDTAGALLIRVRVRIRVGLGLGLGLGLARQHPRRHRRNGVRGRLRHRQAAGARADDRCHGPKLRRHGRVHGA